MRVIAILLIAVGVVIAVVGVQTSHLGALLAGMLAGCFIWAGTSILGAMR